MSELKTRAPAPLWLEPVLSKTRGLDLLGLRAPVQVIGNQLMNGITTITPAVRYLSLRAWLIRAYANARAPDDWKVFRDWSALAEASIAVGNRAAHTDASGLVGSERAGRILESADKTANLEPLVGQLAVQVYANPSADLGISFPRDSGVSGLTKERGLELAMAVDEQISANHIADELRAGRSVATASIDQLRQFGGQVALNQIPERERSTLVDTILPSYPADSEKNRLSTYTLLLDLARVNSRPPTESDLFDSASAIGHSHVPELQPILDGWLAYLIRDLLAVCHECALKAALEGIQRKQVAEGASVARDVALDSALDSAMGNSDLLLRLNLPLPTENISKLSFNDLFAALRGLARVESNSEYRLGRWAQGPAEHEIAALAAASGSGASVLLPIVWALVDYRAYGQETDPNELPALLSRQGWARMGLADVIKPSVKRFLDEDWSYLEVLRELIQRTVDQHLRIAWTRLRFEREPRDVAVIASDGQRWSFRNDYYPGRSASRLQQAVSWLRQLALIDESGLTKEGEKVLARSLGVMRP